MGWVLSEESAKEVLDRVGQKNGFPIAFGGLFILSEISDFFYLYFYLGLAWHTHIQKNWVRQTDMDSVKNCRKKKRTT